MSQKRRLIATFQPQALVNKCAIDIDGAVEFDATEAFLSKDLEFIRRYADYSYDSDELADDLSERREHRGPFQVECDVWSWLEENGVPQKGQMTQGDLDRLRAEHGVGLGEARPRRAGDLGRDELVRLVEGLLEVLYGDCDEQGGPTWNPDNYVEPRDLVRWVSHEMRRLNLVPAVGPRE